MTYVVNAAFEVVTPISVSDPNVRSITRLPGFVKLESVSADNLRYELTVEVEGGSIRDVMDAAEDLIVEYQDALGAYRPRLLAEPAPQLR
ncbi:MAG: hypothetical protein M3024_01520 [Candidatus Dormibacteraeota bacterium]|nr:hypothetical protein [Candidatus Dormibacteraeota bacterium]